MTRPAQARNAFVFHGDAVRLPDGRVVRVTTTEVGGDSSEDRIEYEGEDGRRWSINADRVERLTTAEGERYETTRAQRERGGGE